MDNTDNIVEGLEIAYKKLIEFKKYKKTPLAILREGKTVEIPPEKITTHNKVYNS